MKYEINLIELPSSEKDRSSPKTAEAWLEYFRKINLFNASDVREVERQMRRHLKDLEELKSMHMRDDVGVAGVVLSHAKTKYLSYFNEITRAHPKIWIDYAPDGNRCDLAEEIREDIRRARTLEGLKIIIGHNSKIIRESRPEPQKGLWGKIRGTLGI